MKKSPGVGIASSFIVLIFVAMFFAFAGLGMLVAGIALATEGKSFAPMLVAGGVVAIALGVVAICLAVKKPKETKEQQAHRNYRALPEVDVDDYKQELQKIACNLQNQPQTMHFESFSQNNQLYNTKVLQDAHSKLHYAIVVCATKIDKQTIVATVFYSTDENLRYNPIALRNEFLQYFSIENEDDLPIIQGIHHNKEIVPNLFLCSIAVQTNQLPFGYFSGWLVPIVADPQNSISAFVVDCTKWTEALLGNFCFGNEKETNLTNQLILKK